MPNRLIGETSPYLQQHAHNPVDWYPWGPEALERARREDRPIFLSIGYSACHWCHVMEHESFEDEDTARVMNEHFVNIKVDREERPDLDGLYMQAVQLMTGHGGWPMSVWLTPDLEPFYGGTYFPPNPKYGMPSFKMVLDQLADTWANRRDDIRRASTELSEALRQMSQAPPRGGELLAEELEDHAFRAIRGNYDPYHGGFGGAPKFPAPMNLRFLLRYWKAREEQRALDMVDHTLRKMARGGMYDQLGGGFHRYSVDAEWLVPHFEKMLYDNALLVPAYVEAWQATGDAFHRRVAEETLDYLLREMTSPEGAFYSTQDADSEGEEGKFFAWTPEEITRVLGAADGKVAAEYWGVTPHGNFEHGKSVLHAGKDDDVAAHLLGMKTPELQARLPDLRRRLFEAREERVHPGRDEKVLAAWNGMALAAFAEAFGAFGEARYLEAARRNAAFVLERMGTPDGRLHRSFKDGEARLNAYLEDYACFTDGLVALYQVDLDPRWLEEARRLADLVLDRFWDPEGETFWQTDRDHEQLVARPRDLIDNATPAGNSVTLLNLLRLYRLTGEARYEEVAVRALGRLAGTVRRSPSAFGCWLQALDLHLRPPVEVALVGERGSPEVEGFVRAAYSRFVPQRLVALGPGPAVPFLEGKTPVDGAPTAYLCQGASCLPPVTDAEALARELP